MRGRLKYHYTEVREFSFTEEETQGRGTKNLCSEVESRCIIPR